MDTWALMGGLAGYTLLLAATERGLVRVAFDGAKLVVVDEGSAFESSGQKLFDFGLGELARGSDVSPSPASSTSPGCKFRGSRSGRRCDDRASTADMT